MSLYNSTTKGVLKVGKTIKARFSKGIITPMEKVDILDGKEITITIIDIPAKTKKDAFESSAGAWKGTIDANKLIENIYTDRLLATRKTPTI